MIWKNKFPAIFNKFPTFFTKLTPAEDEYLSNLVSNLEKEGLLDVGGFSRAVELFAHCDSSFRKDNFKALHILIPFMADPLCQIIFDARVRNFSAYSEPPEPLNTKGVADEIVGQLLKLHDSKNPEKTIRLFFDFFATFRPFPSSQSEICQISTSKQIRRALESHCIARISAINTKQDYADVVQMITELRTKKGEKRNVFDAIKYVVACRIESDDMCSMRKYDQLMNEIRETLENPQPKLSKFKEELEQTTGYKQTMSDALKSQSLLMPPQAKEKGQEAACVDMYSDPQPSMQ